MDVYGQAQVIAEMAASTDAPVAGRLPGQSVRFRVLVTAAAPAVVFGLDRSQAGRPPNLVKQPARMIRLAVDATAGLVSS